MHYSYTPKGVCAMNIQFDIDSDNKITNVEFMGGCHGNLQAVSKLVNGMSAEEINGVLAGNDCRGRGTSCADQLAKAVMEAASKNG